MTRIFISATVKGPTRNEQGQMVYTIEGLWQDTSGPWRRAYGESQYPEMVTDFAAWPNGNNQYPDAVSYASQAHWQV